VSTFLLQGILQIAHELCKCTTLFFYGTDYATYICMIYWLYYIRFKYHNLCLKGLRLAVARINIEGNRA